MNKLVKANATVRSPLLKKAREIYNEMAHSWVSWAIVLHEIRDSRVYEQDGFRSFDAYCGQEFPSFSSGSISKALQAYERFRPSPQDKNLSFDCLYRILSVESEITVERFDDLSSGYLKGQLTPKHIRAEVDQIKAERRKNQSREDAEIEAEIDREVAEINEESGNDTESEIIDEEQATSYQRLVVDLENCVVYLIENIPEFMEQFDETLDKKELKTFILKLKKLGSIAQETVDELKNR